MLQRPESGEAPQVVRSMYVVYVDQQQPPRFSSDDIENAIANSLMWVEGIGNVTVDYLADASLEDERVGDHVV